MIIIAREFAARFSLRWPFGLVSRGDSADLFRPVAPTRDALAQPVGLPIQEGIAGFARLAGDDRLNAPPSQVLADWPPGISLVAGPAARPPAGAPGARAANRSSVEDLHPRGQRGLLVALAAGPGEGDRPAVDLGRDAALRPAERLSRRGLLSRDPLVSPSRRAPAAW